MTYSTRETCRLCTGSLETVISLGDIYLSTFLTNEKGQPPKAPIELTVCTQCNLAQLRHTVDPTVMYQQYWYQSGLNDSMRMALRDVVNHVRDHTYLSEGDVVVDIGSNDGTLLACYNERVIKIGFEPSNVANDLTAPSEVIHDYFSASTYYDRIAVKAKVITAVAMFYDLEDPHSFVEDLYKVIADDGIIVIQMMDMLSMFKLADFPNLCHEHLAYYTLSVLNTLMLEHHLEIFDLDYNGVNGGSLRVYVRKSTMPYTNATVRLAIEKEDEYFRGLGDPYAYFRDRIETVRTKVVQEIRDLVKMGKTIAVMGASTKGNTTLQYFGLNERDISHAAEVNPDKFGLRTVGSNIPIISQDESLALNPDYYLILPWGFIDNFITKCKPYFANGGAFIVPLPEPRTIALNTLGELETCYL